MLNASCVSVLTGIKSSQFVARIEATVSFIFPDLIAFYVCFGSSRRYLAFLGLAITTSWSDLPMGGELRLI